MDSILRKLYECGAYEQRARAALLRAVAARANSPPAPALRPGELSGVLRVGVDIIIGSESPVLAEAALFVVQQFAARDIQWVLDNAVLALVEPLMSAANQSGHSVSLQLLKWLIVTSSNDTMTSSANDALTSSVGSLLATFVKSRAPLTVSWLSELSLLLTDMCPSALPVGDDACALAEALVHGLCALHPPSEPAAVGDFLRRLWLVQCLCSRVFACDNRCALRAMDALYSAMSPADGGVSVSLSVVLQALPQRLIKPACSELVQMLATTASSSAGGGGAVCSMLVCLCDWLLVWPSRAWSAGVYSGDAGAPCAAGGAVLTVWLAVLIRQLAERRLSHVLVQLTLARVEKLFSGLFLPAFRAAIFPVVSLLLLGFQHSSEAFDKVAASAPSLLRQIGRECANAAADTSCADDCRTQRSQLADLLHTLLFLHSQSSTTISSAHDKYSDLRATLQCQDVAAPQPARMTSFLAAARWTPHLASPLAGALQQQSAAAVVVGEASAAAAVGMGVGVAAVSDQRGLTNLGNTCFMNAVIQALFAVKHFRVAVLLSRPSVQHRLLAGLQRVFAFLQFGRRAVYTPSMFHRLALPPWFETGRQHDCTEFLRYMLNALNEEHRSIASSSAGADDSVPSPATMNAGDRAATTRFPADVRQRTAPVCRRASRSLDDSDTARPAGCGGRARRRRRLSDGDMSVGSEYGGRSVTSVTCQSATDGERSCDSSDSGIQSGGCVSVSDKPSSLVSDDGSSLVRRLLSGCMETSYTCLGCHTVSRHVDTFTDLNLTFPADRPSLTAPVAVDGNEQHSPHNDVSPSKIAAVDCQHAAAGSSSSSVSSPERVPLRGDSWPPNDGADSNGNHLLSASRPDARAVVVHKADDIGCRIGRLPDDDVQMSSVCATTNSGHSDDAGGADCNSGGVSVCQLLDYYMSRERLTGDNRYWCEQCGQLRDADRRLRLLAAPGCLLVSLSRFVYDRRAAVRRKLLTPVRLERRLCMRVDDACPGGGGGSGDNSEQQQQQAVVYDLQAVVVHSGASLDAGHYYCCARTGPASASNSASDTTAAAAQPADPLDRSDHSASTDTPGGAGGEWCRFDDSHVSRVCTEYVQRLSELLPADTAYMLVYVRRQLATAAPPAVHRLQLPEPLRHDIVAENAAAG